MKIPKLVIVGTGLIGSSIALAAKRRHLVERVIGVDQNREVCARAGVLGLIDEECSELAEAAAHADFLVVCTPVDTIAANILTAARACRPGTVLTDVGSTKANLVRTIEDSLPPGILFVGSHPLAGSEKTGPAFANPELFDERLVLLTPTARTNPDAITRVRAFWQALGAGVRLLDPEEHDRALAMTSHLPHVAAAALAGILPVELLALTATGFRDTTRIAAGPSSLWRAILQDNRVALLDAVVRLRAQLDEFAQALENDDGPRLAALLEQGRQIRALLG